MSVVGARLSDLESASGVKLIRRTTRVLTVTQEGSSFYRRTKQILRGIQSAATEVTAKRHTLVGPLRVSALAQDADSQSLLVAD